MSWGKNVLKDADQKTIQIGSIVELLNIRSSPSNNIIMCWLKILKKTQAFVCDNNESIFLPVIGLDINIIISFEILADCMI